MCAGQRVSRYKKPLYVKLDKNLSELVAAYDPSKLLSFLKRCSSNIKLLFKVNLFSKVDIAKELFSINFSKLNFFLENFKIELDSI